MATHALSKIPANGDRITSANGRLEVPDNPIFPFVEGDGKGMTA
jgi:isocitrate dehydrogenase